MEKLVGTGVAVITPFKEDGSVDFIGLDNVIEHLIQNGINYLVVLGTTAETATLSFEEKTAVLARVKKANANRLPIVLGLGGNNTADLIKDFENYDLDGVEAILSASPYYNKPTQEGIYHHYKALSEASPLPIILYNVPGRTASNIEAATTLRLANDFKNIIGIKEASANLIQIMEIVRDRPSGFLMISGDDAFTYPMMACGGEGVISVAAHAYPKQFSEMISKCLKKNFTEASEIHYELLAFNQMIFEEGNPGGIKAAMKHLGVCGDTLRLPLYRISESLDLRLKETLRKS